MGAGTARTLDDRALVRVMKALGDPSRFRMMQEIAGAGELSCGEVAERFDLSQPTVSHHLKILMDSGILVMRTEGKHRYTSVNRALLAELGVLLPERLAPSVKRPLDPGRGRARGKTTA